MKTGIPTDIYTKEEIKKVKSLENDHELLKVYKTIKIHYEPHKYAYPFSVKLKGNYLYLRENINGSVAGYLWTLEGKPLGQIGSIGKGPGEYDSLWDIVFINEKQFYGVDRGRKIFILYKIKDGHIEFVDQYNVDSLFDCWFDEIFFDNGLIYCMSYSGPEGSHQIYVLNNKFELVNKIFKRNYESDAIVPTGLFHNKKIVFSGEYSLSKGKHVDSRIYIYSISGTKVNIFDTKEHNIKRLWIDKNSKYIFVLLKNNIKIFDLRGKLLNTVKRNVEFKREKGGYIISGKPTKYDDIVFAYTGQKPGELVVKLYKCEI